MRLFILLFIILVFMISFIPDAGAEGPATAEQLFYAGNDYYEKGDYVKAINEYNKIIDSGYESANVYYNLGNAYFRAGEPGKSILNYERAKRLKPKDADIDANYRFVRTRIKGAPVAQAGIWGWKPLRRYHENFTVNRLLLISSGFYVAGVIVLLAAVYRRYLARRLITAAFLVFLCMALNLFVTWHKINEIGTEAIIVVPRADSHYGPSDSATVFFKLHEGMKVNVLKERDDWYEIKRADGKKGWVRKQDLEII